MKKIILAFIILLCCMLCACGPSGDPVDTDTSSQTDTVTDTDTGASTDTDTDTGTDTDTDTDTGISEDINEGEDELPIVPIK